MGKFQSFTLTIDSNATCCYFFCAPIWMIGANLCASYMFVVINSSGSIVYINSRVIHCEVQVCTNAVTICESYAERTALCRTNSFNTVYDVQSIQLSTTFTQRWETLQRPIVYRKMRESVNAQVFFLHIWIFFFLPNMYWVNARSKQN